MAVDRAPVQERAHMTCLLPDTRIGVTMWDRHPCDDRLYMVEAWCYGPTGRIGYWRDALRPQTGLGGSDG